MATKYDFVSSEKLFGLAKIKKGDLWGLLNIDKMTEVVSPRWEKEPDFVHGHIIFKNPRAGIIDKEGKVLIPPIFSEIFPQKADTIVVQTITGSYGIYNEDGEEILPAIYEQIEYVHDNCIIVKKGGKYGIINANRKIRLLFEYDNLFYCWKDNIIFGQKDGKWGCVNRYLKEMVPFEFDNICIYNGFFLVEKGRYKGLYDINGNCVLPANKYYYVCPIYDKLFIVARYGKEGLILRDGTVVIKCIYENIFDIGNGYFKVYKEYKDCDGNRTVRCGIINSAGEVIVPLKYDGIMEYKDDIIIVVNKTKVGCISIQGKVLVKPEYDRIDYKEGEKYIKVYVFGERHHKCGLFDTDGNQITDVIYDFVSTVPNEKGMIQVTYAGKEGTLML